MIDAIKIYGSSRISRDKVSMRQKNAEHFVYKKLKEFLQTSGKDSYNLRYLN